MTDPRLSLAGEMFEGEVERVIGHLDRHRPVIKVGDSAGPAGRLAAMTAYSTAVRLFPHAVLDGTGEVPFNPWRVQRLEDLPGQLAGALPTAAISPEVDITLGVAINSGADLYMGADDWTAAIGRSAVPGGQGDFPIGWQGAAVLATTEVAKTVWRGLGLVVNPVGQEFVWNYLDHRCRPAPEVGRLVAKPIRIALLGGGSAGSSVVGVAVMVGGASGNAVVVDDDHFDPTRNPYRYPAATASTHGSKAEWLAGLLKDAGWAATPQRTTVGEWVPSLSTPGFDGVAVSSVDDVDGRFEVADLLAHTTLSLGIKGLALHLQREHLGDHWACPFCDFVNSRPAISESQADEQFTGIPMACIETLRLTRGRLSADDLQHAVAAGRIRAEAAERLVGKRLDDLLRQVYADALVPGAAGQPPTPNKRPPRLVGGRRLGRFGAVEGSPGAAAGRPPDRPRPLRTAPGSGAAARPRLLRAMYVRVTYSPPVDARSLRHRAVDLARR